MQAGQPGRRAGGDHGLGDQAPSQSYPQQAPAGGALGDQAGEHGGERRQQRRRVQLAHVRPQYLDQVLVSLVQAWHLAGSAPLR